MNAEIKQIGADGFDGRWSSRLGRTVEQEETEVTERTGPLFPLFTPVQEEAAAIVLMRRTLDLSNPAVQSSNM